ncbi:transglutaminase family protein [Leptolyngbya iicbica LK]|uniref:Transglutaminase family protein n=2 Tax=Cyanophyceae TaxID=3028117 RepID=A0A4Q7E928_9CYAN|nr:transglutaminase family protein [Leptolyngbya sp. LK]RZM79337.1 transglutaminase family protein [Leptolyngbya sp. LK]
MRYHISHTTHYLYPEPVKLGAHTVRLRPRSDGSQHLQQFAIALSPEPSKRSELLDIAGNTCLRLWFDSEEIKELRIYTQAEVETVRDNPFDYLSEPWAINAPFDYPQAIAAHLTPYLRPALSATFSPGVVDLAQLLLHEVRGNVGLFLSRLTQTIYEEFQYFHRPEGEPLPGGITLQQKSGSCRDFAVLFMEACQAVGLAARFVSGYQEGDEEQQSRELHAWPEIYIPGGGWRGFDPTHGLAVSDRHIALAAAAHPQNAAPVAGILQPGYFGQSTLKYQIQMQRSFR